MRIQLQARAGRWWAGCGLQGDLAMEIGIPREIKDGEARAGATPDGVRALTSSGHAVTVEAGAGSRVGFGDDAYRTAGARVVADPDAVYSCSLVVKVKELQPSEYSRLRSGGVVTAYHQLARDPRLLDAVLSRGVTCLAYEGVTAPDCSRPLLAPMSIIAGSMSAQIAAWALQHRAGPLSGSGVLLPGLEGVPPGRVLVIGDGVAGRAAARAFLAMGCSVTVLGVNEALLERLKAHCACGVSGALRVGRSTPEELAARSAEADVMVGAVAVPGRLAPKLVTRAMLRAMRPGSVFIDIGIDMGGISETSRQTALSDPLYVEEGVLHYGVPNIPALVPCTATRALAAATLPLVQLLADQGLDGALRDAPGLRDGLLVHDGQVVHPALAEDTGRPFVLHPGGGGRPSTPPGST